MIPIAPRLQRFLSSHRVDYRLYCHPRTYNLEECAKKHDICEKAFAKTVVLKDRKHYFVAVIPLHCEIDFARLNRLLKREVYMVCPTEADRLFYDCEPFSHPPIAKPYALPVVVDSKLLLNKHVYFEAGSHASVIKLDKSDFCYLMADATWGNFTKSPFVSGCMLKTKQQKSIASNEANCLASDLEKLPPVIKDIINLSKDKLSSPDALTEIFKTDLNITLSLHRYQQAHKEKHQEGLNPTLKRLLAFDRVSHTTLDASVLSSNQIERQGPLGLDSLWLHAKCASYLCYRLASETDYGHEIDPETFYLGGLLHNFGLLFIGYMYAPEFRLLNRWFELNPKSDIKNLEKRLLGLGGAQRLIASGHSRIGYWIMHYWDLPIAVQKMAKHHHNKNYSGNYLPYVKGLMLVNKILRDHGLGEGDRLSICSAGLSDKDNVILDKLEQFYQDWQRDLSKAIASKPSTSNKVS